MRLSRPAVAVVQATRRLIHSVQERSGLCYADAEYGPISPPSVWVIARRLGALVTEGDLGEYTQELGIPGYLGPPVIVVNRYAEPTMRDVALRHGIAHLAAGDLDIGEGMDVRFMSSMLDHMTHEERTADLFALADVVPDRWLDALIASEAKLEAVEQELRRHVKALAPRWPAQRVRDRTRLRLVLYTEGR